MSCLRACTQPALYALLAAALWGAALGIGYEGVSRGTFKLAIPEYEAKMADLRASAAQDRHAHFSKILRNNLLATVLLLIAGVGSVGLFVLFYLGWFGIQMGMVIAVLQQAGIPGALVCALLLPHGLLEVPALCLAAGVGLRCAMIFVRYLRDEGMLRDGELSQLLWTAGVSLGMIVLAALIEAYVTPAVALKYLS